MTAPSLRSRVLTFLQTDGGRWTSAALADELSIEPQACSHALGSLHHWKQVRIAAQYSAPKRRPVALWEAVQ
jgi:hypothetical protein